MKDEVAKGGGEKVGSKGVVVERQLGTSEDRKKGSCESISNTR